MNRAADISAAADVRVRSWPSLNRADLLERLSTPPVVKQLNNGFSVDTGDDFPTFCRDRGEVRKLLDRRALLAAELRDAS